MITKYRQVSPAKGCETVKARVIRYSGDQKKEAQANYDRLSMQGTHCIYVDDDLLQETLCKGISVDSEEYSRAIDGLCEIVTRSGVSVVLCSESVSE